MSTMAAKRAAYEITKVTAETFQLIDRIGRSKSMAATYHQLPGQTFDCSNLIFKVN